MGVRVSSDYEVQVTEEEFELPVGEEEKPPPVPRTDHSTPDRTQARELFERLSILPASDPARARIRATLVELHLPLVEYLARRGRAPGGWLEGRTPAAAGGPITCLRWVCTRPRGRCSACE